MSIASSIQLLYAFLLVLELFDTAVIYIAQFPFCPIQYRAVVESWLEQCKASE